ncbi:MAG: CDP-diacylglycerol--serine O-phosphatidyltransferase [Desulfobacterota bacterium]|nr:CDP-diacylglycerol--serine O-phosphatidyltransferase [Thermodesulfobacteriota bacterium]
MRRKFFNQQKKVKTGKLRKGIYILPNFFTTCSLFCAFYSIISSFNGNFTKAAWAILFSAVFDWLDGKIARASRAISQFGVEYDSLSDLIAFGLAPGLLIYTWGLIPFGRAGWLAAFLYVACTALRLARFNVNALNLETRYFQGLPSPAAGGMIATMVIIAYRLGWVDTSKHLLVLVLTFFLSFMMVSKIRYWSLKKLEVSGIIPFQISVIVLCVIIIIAAEPHFTLFTIFFLYVFSGPVLALEKKLVLLKKKRVERKQEDLPAST